MRLLFVQMPPTFNVNLPNLFFYIFGGTEWFSYNAKNCMNKWEYFILICTNKLMFGKGHKCLFWRQVCKFSDYFETWTSEASHYPWNHPTDKWSLSLFWCNRNEGTPRLCLRWGWRGHFCLPAPERTQSQGKAVRFIVVRPLKSSSRLTKCGDARQRYQLIVMEVNLEGLWGIRRPHLQSGVWWAGAVGKGRVGCTKTRRRFPPPPPRAALSG